jgi:hypothetical protein
VFRTDFSGRRARSARFGMPMAYARGAAVVRFRDDLAAPSVTIAV